MSAKQRFKQAQTTAQRELKVAGKQRQLEWNCMDLAWWSTISSRHQQREGRATGAAIAKAN